MGAQHKRKLIAAAVFAGALVMLVPLTLYAEAGSLDRSRPVADQAAKGKKVAKKTAKKIAKKKEQGLKALVKAKARSVAKKFLPVKHVGDY
jgi:hypothetical protein